MSSQNVTHPSTRWGASWWPGYQHPGLFMQAAKEGNIDALLFVARAFASESIRPRDPDAYCQVEHWNPKDEEEEDDKKEKHAQAKAEG